MVSKKLRGLSFDIVVTKEKTKSGFVFVAEEITTGIVSEGDTYEEAIENLKEALQIHLEKDPEFRKMLIEEKRKEQTAFPMITRIFL